MKKILYLISPRKIKKSFYNNFEIVLKKNKVKFFQLRLKNTKKSKIITISKKIRNITRKYNVKFIINDDYKIAKKVKADGCHIGQLDGDVSLVRNYLKGKIIGVTCHNSVSLAKKAIAKGADYIALGSFYRSKLKPKAKKAEIKNLIKIRNIIKKPIVAIGGVNNRNFKNLLNNGANYIALSSFIWDNKVFKPEEAINKFYEDYSK